MGAAADATTEAEPVHVIEIAGPDGVNTAFLTGIDVTTTLDTSVTSVDALSPLPVPGYGAAENQSV